MLVNLTFAQKGKRENFVEKCSNASIPLATKDLIREYKELYKEYENLYSEKDWDKNPSKTKKDTTILIEKCSYKDLLNEDSDMSYIVRNIIIANFLVRECENYKNRKDLKKFEEAFDRFAEILESIDKVKGENIYYPSYIEEACKNFDDQYNKFLRCYNNHNFE